MNHTYCISFLLLWANYHKFSGWLQHKFIILYFCRLEVQTESQWIKPRHGSAAAFLQGEKDYCSSENQEMLLRNYIETSPEIYTKSPCMARTLGFLGLRGIYKLHSTTDGQVDHKKIADQLMPTVTPSGCAVAWFPWVSRGQDSYGAASSQARLPGSLSPSMMPRWSLHMVPAGKAGTQRNMILTFASNIVY